MAVAVNIFVGLAGAEELQAERIHLEEGKLRAEAAVLQHHGWTISAQSVEVTDARIKAINGRITQGARALHFGDAEFEVVDEDWSGRISNVGVRIGCCEVIKVPQLLLQWTEEELWVRPPGGQWIWLPLKASWPQDAFGLRYSDTESAAEIIAHKGAFGISTGGPYLRANIAQGSALIGMDLINQQPYAAANLQDSFGSDWFSVGYQIREKVGADPEWLLDLGQDALSTPTLLWAEAYGVRPLLLIDEEALGMLVVSDQFWAFKGGILSSASTVELSDGNATVSLNEDWRYVHRWSMLTSVSFLQLDDQTDTRRLVQQILVPFWTDTMAAQGQLEIGPLLGWNGDGLAGAAAIWQLSSRHIDANGSIELQYAKNMTRHRAALFVRSKNLSLTSTLTENMWRGWLAVQGDQFSVGVLGHYSEDQLIAGGRFSFWRASTHYYGELFPQRVVLGAQLGIPCRCRPMSLELSISNGLTQLSMHWGAQGLGAASNTLRAW